MYRTLLLILLKCRFCSVKWGYLTLSWCFGYQWVVNHSLRREIINNHGILYTMTIDSYPIGSLIIVLKNKFSDCYSFIIQR